MIPALANIGAVRLFADGCEAIFGNCFFNRAITLPAAYRDAQPRGLTVDVGLAMGACFDPVLDSFEALRG